MSEHWEARRRPSWVSLKQWPRAVADVVVVNQIAEILEINGVTWLPWDAPRPPSRDLVFAMRKPSLLEEAEAEKCLIWLWGGCKALDNSHNRALLEKHRPALIYVSEAQRLGWKSWRIFPGQVIEPAIARVFLEQEVDDEEPSPLAVTTTHPVHGLRAIIRMWRDNINLSAQTLNYIFILLYFPRPWRRRSRTKI